MYAAFLFLPGQLLIVLLTSGLIKRLFSSWQFYAGLALFMLLSAGMFYMRNLDAPGYANETLFKDAGRLFDAFEGHSRPWDYYLENLIYSRFSFWFLPLLISVGLYAYNQVTDLKMFRTFLILSLSHLLIISVSATKLPWYDMPEYPLLAIVTALGVGHVLEGAIQRRSSGKSAVFLLLIVFSYPYWLMFCRSQSNKMPYGERKNEAIERYIFSKGNGNANLNGLKIYYCGWNGSLLFYKYKLAGEGKDIALTTQAEFKPADRVLLCNDSLLGVLKSRYTYDVLDKAEDATLVKINHAIGEQEI
jgi:hypothetical protein